MKNEDLLIYVKQQTFFHSITMKISDKDDETTLSYLDPKMTLKTQRVYIGGVPKGFEIGSIAEKNSTSLKGCLVDFMVGKLVLFVVT